MNLLDDLVYRELIYQVTDQEALEKRLQSGPITLYVGMDPTADSLHIGNLLQILLLRRFQLAGHHPIALTGGGTGLIGDPGGKSGERTLNEEEIVQEWSSQIRSQMEQYLDFESPTNPARTVNNYEWLSKLSVIPFLRETGKHFPIGVMLSKDSIKSRLEVGISYTEFSYMILQAYDYHQLYKKYGCELQTGGSDQWGNIVAGVELIRRAEQSSVFGLTLPLVTKSDGSKLGKTESGTIWLDPEKTSPYQFYQFWINTNDDDVIRFIKYFTFLAKDEIEELAVEVANTPWEREAQKVLAERVTTLVHGREATARAQKISQAFFYGRVSELSRAEIDEALYDVPTYNLDSEEPIRVVDLLAQAGITASKRRAREDITNGAIHINDAQTTDVNATLAPTDRIAGSFVVIRRGKNKYFLVKWEV